ncbi:hypothetical protein Zmor_011546 [Zophobas morio]|uniref:Uncharacterized protein n=1 Tax=Zophobas morio TaxID=2755281 RepID=A0AA38IR20_9CUCU|nr:hypothetical protein Zmor_011546 [Zophobas morio]
MPSKPKKGVTGDSEIISAVNVCLNNFFKTFSCGCDCSSNISKLSDEISNCKSLIETQTTLISLLQQDITFLKNELHKVRSTSPMSCKQKTTTGDNRRLSLAAKTYEEKNLIATFSRSADVFNTDRDPNKNHRYSSLRATGIILDGGDESSVSSDADNTARPKSSNRQDVTDVKGYNHGQNGACSLFSQPFEQYEDLNKHLDATGNHIDDINEHSVETTKLSSELPKNFPNISQNVRTYNKNDTTQHGVASNLRVSSNQQRNTQIKSRKKFISCNQNLLTGARAKLHPVDKHCWIYVSNLSPSQTVQDILDVLHELDSEANFIVEKPEHLNKRSTSSVFTIRAPLIHQTVLLTPDFWPANTYVNKYFLPRMKQNFPQTNLNPLTT